jgi:hypothetical protein
LGDHAGHTFSKSHPYGIHPIPQAVPGARDQSLGGLVPEIRAPRGPTDQFHRTSCDHLQEYGQVEFTRDLTRHDLHGLKTFRAFRQELFGLRALTDFFAEFGIGFQELLGTFLHAQLEDLVRALALMDIPL